MDLTAVAPDEDAAERTEETVNEILQGRRGAQEVVVITTTREEFRQWALLGQSFAGQAARYGVRPDGKSLNYQPEREPTAEEIRELSIWWLRMAQGHLNTLKYFSENPRLADSEYQGLQAQWGLERSFKGLLAAGNDPIRFKRDAALTWRHVESTHPIADREASAAGLLQSRCCRPSCDAACHSERSEESCPRNRNRDPSLHSGRQWKDPSSVIPACPRIESGGNPAPTPAPPGREPHAPIHGIFTKP